MKQLNLNGKVLTSYFEVVKIYVEQTEISKPFIYTKNGDGKTAQLIEAVNNIKKDIVEEKPFRDGKRFYLNSLNFNQAREIVKMAQLPFLRREYVSVLDGVVIK